jgi:hypothetical protein
MAAIVTNAPMRQPATVNLFSTPDAAAQQAQLQRAQQLANMLDYQALQPVETTQPGAPVSWTQGLAKMVAALGAGKASKRVETLQSQVAKSQQDQLNSLFQSPQAAPQPAPQVPQGAELPPGAGVMRPGAVNPAAQLGASLAPQSPMPSLTGDPQRDKLLVMTMGLPAYAAAAAKQFEPTEQQRNDRAAGIDPQTRRALATHPLQTPEETYGEPQKVMVDGKTVLKRYGNRGGVKDVTEGAPPSAQEQRATGTMLSPDSLERQYQAVVATGSPEASFPRAQYAQVQLQNYIAKRAAEDGNTALATAAKRQKYAGIKNVLNDFQATRVGTAGGNLVNINTAVGHMDTLEPLIDALGTGDVKALNAAKIAFEKQTGDPAPTNYDALKEYVAGEIAKVVLPGGGGEEERQALGAPLSSSNSPQAIKTSVGIIKKALASKTDALRTQWDNGTDGTQGPFEKFLNPATKKALGIKEDAPAQEPGAPRAAPTGVDPDLWKHMTPQEQALWQ